MFSRWTQTFFLLNRKKRGEKKEKAGGPHEKQTNPNAPALDVCDGAKQLTMMTRGAHATRPLDTR